MSLIARRSSQHPLLHAWLSVVAYALVALPFSAHAVSQQERSQYLVIKIRPSYLRCLDASGGVTPSMKSCMSDEFEFQDKRLNSAYKQLMSSIDETHKTSLRAEERQWIRRKESTCRAPAEAGQGDELVAYDCVVVQTATRASDLEGRLVDPATYGAKPLEAGRDVLSSNAKSGLRPSYQACVDSSFANNPKMIACADEELSFQESRLKRARERQDASVAPDGRPSLAADQKRWADSLDKQCDIRPDASQSEEVQAADCRLEGTASRANELEKLLAK